MKGVSTTRLVAVAAEFEPGILESVVAALADADISIEAYAADASGLRLYPDRVDDAKEALSAAGFFCQIVEVLEVDVTDRAGILRDVLQVLTGCGAQIISSIGMGIHGNGKIYVRVDRLDVAMKALNQA